MRSLVQSAKAACAKTIVKGKSMVSEEIGLNHFVEKRGMEIVETDLGEYILQIRDETPSHIIAPAIHLTKDDVERDFRRVHTLMPKERRLDDPASLLAEARTVLRHSFLRAEVGITGANFLVAETGSAVLVTNEGNGDLTQTLPRTHIVLATIEKLVPTLDDAAKLIRVLARSATGQDITAYTTFTSGPRKADDPDGPTDYHVVILDNGRSAMLNGEFHEMLRCIRCGACMNHCPVFNAIGGHAYGWVYPGPMGSVLTPSLKGIEQSSHLPNASTMCGRCESVCPVRIPLPRMLRSWREREFERHLSPASVRRGLRLWGFLVRRPTLYGVLISVAARTLHLLGRSSGRLRRLPMAFGWTKHRDLPVPQGSTFQALWRRQDHWRKFGPGQSQRAKGQIET